MRLDGMRISLQPKSARELPAFVNTSNATGMSGEGWLINCGFNVHAASKRSKHIGNQRLFLFMVFSSGVHHLSAFSVSRNTISDSEMFFLGSGALSGTLC